MHKLDTTAVKSVSRSVRTKFESSGANKETISPAQLCIASDHLPCVQLEVDAVEIDDSVTASVNFDCENLIENVKAIRFANIGNNNLNKWITLFSLEDRVVDLKKKRCESHAPLLNPCSGDRRLGIAPLSQFSHFLTSKSARFPPFRPILMSFKTHLLHAVQVPKNSN